MPVRYKVNKYKINTSTWLVLWTDQYGECHCEYFYVESEADSFVNGEE